MVSGWDKQPPDGPGFTWGDAAFMVIGLAVAAFYFVVLPNLM